MRGPSQPDIPIKAVKMARVIRYVCRMAAWRHHSGSAGGMEAVR